MNRISFTSVESQYRDSLQALEYLVYYIYYSTSILSQLLNDVQFQPYFILLLESSKITSYYLIMYRYCFRF